jgi:hypothetical protein
MHPHPWARVASVIVGGWLLTPLTAAPAMAEQPPSRVQGCAELFQLPGLAWRGSNGTMTLEQLASYVAPVLWFSPDEPTLQRRSGRDIRIPTTLPFEPPTSAPVMYYQVTTIDGLPGEKADALQPDRSNTGQSIVHFDRVTALRIKYLAYFPEESGVGQHLHDIEPTEVRVVVGRANGTLARDRGFVCDSEDYLIAVLRVTGEAHGNPWYYNVLIVDADTRLPIHVLVEEGKHGMATDKNADGYYTPGYDVSVRTNDAWGVRDTIRGGSLLSGKFEGWMAKVRRPEHRVLPPLPSDSPLRERLLNRNGEAPDNVVYELRAYPSSSLAKDRLLRQKIAEKETPDWPVVQSRATVGPILEAIDEGRELKPFSVAYRYDGTAGFAAAFPLLIFKNVSEPLSGGYLVNRLYTSDKNLRDWGWMVMYTPSGSRWFDEYLAGGMDTNRFENDDGTIGKTRAFVLEAGIKLRFRAPNRILGSITNFWGFRAGVKSVGAFDIDGFSYIIEIGAGVW